MMKIAGSTAICTEKASRTSMPLEYVLTGCSRKRPMSAKLAMSSNFSSTSALANPSSEALRYTFSRPVYSMLKPLPSSSRAAMRPNTSTCPVVGRTVPAMICRSVDLPAPLRPMMPRLSPRRTSKDNGCNAVKSWCSASRRSRRAFSGADSGGRNARNVRCAWLSTE